MTSIAGDSPRLATGVTATRAVTQARRILLVESNEDGTVGGSHQALFDLVTNLDRQAFEPVVLFYEDNKFAERLRSLGVAVRVWRAEREREHGWRSRTWLPFKVGTACGVAGAITRRVRLLRRDRIDLVHLNNSPCVGFSDWLPAARLAQIPITSHSRGPYAGPSSGIGRWLTRRFDSYIAISRYIAGDLANHGIRGDRIRQVYDGIDLTGWQPPTKEESLGLRAQYGVPDDALLVVLVGLIRFWKGQSVAIEALRRLDPQTRRRLRLWIIGGEPASDKEYATGLRNQVAELQLENEVSFLGHRFDVARLMSAADVVLHASTVPEPFGLVVVEGLALGKAVVASSLGAPSEIVEKGAGVLFDPSSPRQLADILGAFVKDRGQRDEFYNRATQRARDFDVRRTVDGVTNLWSDTLASHGRKRGITHRER